MIRGIYAAASGMIAEGLRTDVTANNLANVNTTGFKKEIAGNKDFEKMLLWRINDGLETPQIGSVGAGAAVDQIVTDHSQGSTRSTQGSLDHGCPSTGTTSVWPDRTTPPSTAGPIIAIRFDFVPSAFGTRRVGTFSSARYRS